MSTIASRMKMPSEIHPNKNSYRTSPPERKCTYPLAQGSFTFQWCKNHKCSLNFFSSGHDWAHTEYGKALERGRKKEKWCTRYVADLTFGTVAISLPFKLQATCFEFWRFLSNWIDSSMFSWWRIVRSRTTHQSHYHRQFRRKTVNQSFVHWMEYSAFRLIDTMHSIHYRLAPHPIH